MRLAMTLLVSDEDDLVEANLAYHFARGVDCAVVTANHVSDATLDVLERAAASNRVLVIHEPGGDHAQGRWATRMARLACTHFGADWIINLDADEFYWPEESDGLNEIFAAIPERWGLLEIPFCHFLPPRHEGGTFPDHLRVREVRSLKPRGHSHLTKVAHRASPQVTVSRGCHHVTDVDFEPVPVWRPILALHFPLRGYAQFERKVIKSGEATEVNRDPRNHSERNQERLELYREGRLPQFYADFVLDEKAEARGRAEGRLVVDERLHRWFAEHSSRWQGEPRTHEHDEETVAETRAALMRALHEWECSPVRRALVKAERHERRAARLERRLRVVEASPERRLRSFVTCLAAKLRALARRSPASDPPP